MYYNLHLLGSIPSLIGSNFSKLLLQVSLLWFTYTLYLNCIFAFRLIWNDVWWQQPAILPHWSVYTGQKYMKTASLYKYSPDFVSLSQSHASSISVNDLWKETRYQLDNKNIFICHKQIVIWNKQILLQESQMKVVWNFTTWMSCESPWRHLLKKLKYKAFKNCGAKQASSKTKTSSPTHQQASYFSPPTAFNSQFSALFIWRNLFRRTPKGFKQSEGFWTLGNV